MMILADGRMVVAQQGHHVFGVRALGEAGEAAQVTEERGYLSSMAFELLLAAGRDDQISHLRRQEAPQPAHALDFAYLVGDALFELLVELLDLLRSLTQFVQQSHVLNRNGSLIGESLDERYLPVGERSDLQDGKSSSRPRGHRP